MKHLLIMAIAVFTLASAPVLAQSSSAGLIAGSQSSSGAAAGAQSTLYLDQRAPSSTNATINTKQSGKVTNRVEAAPALGSLALGGGHPCQFTPVSAQLSIIGGAGGFGAGDIDEACMLMLLAAQGYAGASQATVYMIAGRDRDACKAMYKAGMVSDCTNKQGKSYVKAAPTVSTRSVPTARPVARPAQLYSKCYKKEGSIRITLTSAGRANRDAAISACRSSLK